MKVLAVGGGSGGHVTPVVAVLSEVVKLSSRPIELRFWVDRKFARVARQHIAAASIEASVSIIVSGKLRRYHHLPVWRQLLMPSVVFPNLFDGVKVIIGALQSLVKLVVWRPDVVFAKGGFVCLPVGWAAHLLKIPLVIHDSDTVPGLTNRLLAPWATAIGTGAPLEYYDYESTKAHYVGIPVAKSLQPVDSSRQQELKKNWQLPADRPLVVVTGGGLGATRINQAVVEQIEQLLDVCSVLLLTGEANYDNVKKRLAEVGNDHFQVHKFVSDMPSLLRAADVVVARAGATTMAELAALKKPTIIVPNARLTGGHQVKNAAMFAGAEAVIVLNETAMESDSGLLYTAIKQLIDSPVQARAMGDRLSQFAKPMATQDMATLILQVGSDRTNET